MGEAGTADCSVVLSTIGMTDSLEESSSYSWVSVDDYAESYKMTDYLCKLGHKEF